MTTPLVYGIFLFLLGCIISTIATQRRIDGQILVFAFGISFLVRCSLIYLNENLGIFEQKLAGDIAMTLYDPATRQLEVFSSSASAIELWIQQTFLVQAIVNWPGVIAFGLERTVFLLTNAFFGAMTGLIGYIYLERLFNWAVGFWAFVLLSIYPAAMNFSIFALRDIIIYFFTTMYILSVVWLYIRSWAGPVIGGMLVSGGAVVSLRPEMVPMLLVPVALFLLVKSREKLEQIVKKRARMLMLYVLMLVVGGVGSVGGWYSYKMALSAVGYSEVIAPAEVVQDFAQRRYARGTESGQLVEGGESHIVSPAIYKSLPAAARIGIQTLGIIIVPMPWLLTKLSRVLAGVDTIFILACVVLGLRNIQWRSLERRSVLLRRDRVVSGVLFGAFAISVLGLGLVVSNAGNAFRMRLPFGVYVIIPASIYIGRYLYERWSERRRLQGGVLRGPVA